MNKDQIILNKFYKFEDTNLTPKVAGIGVSIDVETTGLNSDTDEAIEVGIVKFLFDKRGGDIIKVLDRYSGFEEPSQPLDQKIIDITGIRDEDLKGKSFNDKKVGDMLSDASFIMAHNAGFDRKFIERRFQGFESKPWVCSLNDYDWLSDGIGKASLELLSFKVGGVYYDAHRALVDAEVMLQNFGKKSPLGGTYLLNMAKNAFKDSYIVYAINAPFSMKDALKNRGYQWSPGSETEPKCWSIKVSDKEDLNNELEYLSSCGLSGAQVSNVNATTRYSVRESEGRHPAIMDLDRMNTVEMDNL